MTDREKIDAALQYIRGQQLKEAQHRVVTHRPALAEDRERVGERPAPAQPVMERRQVGGLIREERER